MESIDVSSGIQSFIGQPFYNFAYCCPLIFFFTLTFTLNPETGELFSSGHSQERDKRQLKVVHSIEVLLQVNLLTILSTLVISP